MRRFASSQHHGFVVLLALCLAISGSLSGLAQSPIHGTGGPVLTFAGASIDEPNRITVKGENFSPEGSVYLVLFDHNGAKLSASRWIVADLMGSDAATGVIHNTLGALCGLGAMTQAYDESTQTWSNILFIERHSYECTSAPHFLPA